MFSPLSADSSVMVKDPPDPPVDEPGRLATAQTLPTSYPTDLLVATERGQGSCLFGLDLPASAADGSGIGSALMHRGSQGLLHANRDVDLLSESTILEVVDWHGGAFPICELGTVN